MRLVGRAVVEVRQQTGTELSVSDLMNLTMFKTVVKAVKFVAGMTFESEFEILDHPVNVTKLGQHHEKITQIKETEVQMVLTRSREAKEFRKLIKGKWRNEVGYLVLSIISERNLNKKTEVPLPSDLKKRSLVFFRKKQKDLMPEK